MTPDAFRSLCPAAQAADLWAAELSAAAEQFGLTSRPAFCMWLAQCCHECAGFTRFEEGLNYSADRLAAVWPGRYSRQTQDPNDPARLIRVPNDLALRLHRNPEAIANDCYANRMGNGLPESGDGWRYRGRGPIQLTGKDMYQRCGLALGFDLVSSPELLFEPYFGARSAAWLFVVEKRCLVPAEAGDVRTVTRRINGGEVGLNDRIEWLHKVSATPGVSPS